MIFWGEDAIVTPENLHRYVLTVPHIKSKVVLDVGCKRGEGTKFYSQYAKKVVAVDVQDRFIYKDEFTFYQMDFERDVPFKKDFDAVVCIEVLEHVHHPEKLIANIEQSLKDGGELILTTPCIDRDIRTHITPFFEEEELRDLLSNFDIKEFKMHNGVSWFARGVL